MIFLENIYKIIQARVCSSPGRAPPWHGGGRGFDPLQIHQMPDTSLLVNIDKPIYGKGKKTSVNPLLKGATDFFIFRTSFYNSWSFLVFYVLQFLSSLYLLYGFANQIIRDFLNLFLLKAKAYFAHMIL